MSRRKENGAMDVVIKLTNFNNETVPWDREVTTWDFFLLPAPFLWEDVTTLSSAWRESFGALSTTDVHVPGFGDSLGLNPRFPAYKRCDSS